MAEGDIKILNTLNLENEQTLLVNYAISTPGTWIYSLCECGYRNVCEPNWTIMLPNHQHPRHTDARPSQPLYVANGGYQGTFAWNYGGIPGIEPEDFDPEHSYLVQLTIVDELACGDPGQSGQTGQTGITGSYVGTGLSGTSGGLIRMGWGSIPPFPGGSIPPNPGGPDPKKPKPRNDPDPEPTNPSDPIPGEGRSSGGITIGIDPYGVEKIKDPKETFKYVTYEGLVDPEPIPGPDPKANPGKQSTPSQNAFDQEGVKKAGSMFTKSRTTSLFDDDYEYPIGSPNNPTIQGNKSNLGYNSIDFGKTDTDGIKNELAQGPQSSKENNNIFDLSEQDGITTLKVTPTTLTQSKPLTVLSSYIPTSEIAVFPTVYINEEHKSHTVYIGDNQLASNSNPATVNKIFMTDAFKAGTITVTVVYKDNEGNIAGIQTTAIEIINDVESDKAVSFTYDFPETNNVSAGLRKAANLIETPIVTRLNDKSERLYWITRKDQVDWLDRSVGNILDASIASTTLSDWALTVVGGQTAHGDWTFNNTSQYLIKPQGIYIGAGDLPDNTEGFIARPATNGYGILMVSNHDADDEPYFFRLVNGLDKRDDYHFSFVVKTPIGDVDSKTLNVRIYAQTNTKTLIYDVSSSKWSDTQSNDPVWNGSREGKRVGFSFSTKDPIFDDDYPTAFNFTILYNQDDSLAQENYPVHILSDFCLTTTSSMSLISTSTNPNHKLSIYDAHTLLDPTERTTLDSSYPGRTPRNVYPNSKPLFTSVSPIKSYSSEHAVGIDSFDSSLYSDFVIGVSNSVDGEAVKKVINLYFSDDYKIREIGSPTKTESLNYSILTPLPRETVGMLVRGYTKDAIPESLNIIYANADSAGLVEKDLGEYAAPNMWVSFLEYPYKIGSNIIGTVRIEE